MLPDSNRGVPLAAEFFWARRRAMVSVSSSAGCEAHGVTQTGHLNPLDLSSPSRHSWQNTCKHGMTCAHPTVTRKTAAKLACAYVCTRTGATLEKHQLQGVNEGDIYH